jgi:F-type H+-transporting ATPase subunit b
VNINLTVLGQIISLFLFVWFCMKFVWPPIIQALAEREMRIADGLAAADKGQRELADAETRRSELQQEGRDKAQDYIAKARARGDDLVEEAKADARSEGERLLAEAREQAAQELSQAREALRSQVATLAVAGAEQILMREVDQAAHRQYLDKLSAEL